MLQLRKLILISLSIFVMGSAYSQLNGNCPGCVANTAQFGAGVTDFSVGLFPDTVIITQNAAVNLDVTYLLPKQAATGISIAPTATVNEVQILGINGSNPLPSGLSVTCDQVANNCAYFPQTYRFGCVKICGTTPDPATNGFVLAKITVAGTGSAAGQTQTQNQDISFYYKILPDTTACHTVCFQNKINSGCDSATLGIYAGIDIHCADPILHPCSFDWDFGNGTTGSGLNNQSAKYAAIGSYPVTLTTHTKKLQVTAASFTVPPDPTLFGIACFSGCSWYNNICNGSGVNNSANNFDVNVTIGSSNFSTGGAGGGNLTGNFTGLHFDVTSQAVSLYVHDACLLSNITTATTTFIITGPGVYPWSIGTDATGTLTVSELPMDSASYVDSAYIFASPDTPIISLAKDTLCQGDSVMLTISGQLYAGDKISWYQDSIYLSDYTDTFAYVHNPGNYTVKVVNQTTHCQAISQPQHITVSGSVPFSATIYYDNSGHQLFLNPFLPGNTSVWYLDSVLVSGVSGQFLPSPVNGTYYAYVYPTGFPQCSLLSNIYTQNLPNGIEEAAGDVTNLSVYPNPNNGTFAVRVNVLTPGAVNIKLTDMLGRTVYEKALVNQTGEIKDNVNVSELTKNVYTLEVTTDRGRATKRVVID